MAAIPIDVPAVTAAGFAALKRGDARAARTSFDLAVGGGVADAGVWFGLAGAHRMLGHSTEEGVALDRALELDPRHLPALIAKGDGFVQRGDPRAADAYYGAALKIAAGLPSLAPEWRAELRRVEAASQGFARDYQAHLLGALAAAGFGARGTERFAHAVDLLLGKRRLYLQQPKYFFYPELPHIQFFDRGAFSWVGSLEEEFESIRAESFAVLETDAAFVPYVQREPNRPSFDVRGLLENPGWGAFFLIKDGVMVEENAARCPRTVAALSRIPLCEIEQRTPSVLFSLLRPGARIPPHHGFTNARIVGHLPLIVPPDCALRVGNETRAWREGETVLFDDSIEHEAWNSSPEPRLVLIFDVWRPELSETERGLVKAMLAAIDAYGATRLKWTE